MSWRKRGERDRELSQEMIQTIRLAADMVEMCDDTEADDEREITIALPLPLAWGIGLMALASIDGQTPPEAREFTREFSRRVMAAYQQQIVGL